MTFRIGSSCSAAIWWRMLAARKYRVLGVSKMCLDCLSVVSNFPFFFLLKEMDKLESSSEEATCSEEEEKELEPNSKGKTPLKGPFRRKRAYVEIEYEQEVEPLSKSKETLLGS